MGETRGAQGFSKGSCTSICKAVNDLVLTRKLFFGNLIRVVLGGSWRTGLQDGDELPMES